MIRTLVCLLALVTSGVVAHAGELDRESVPATRPAVAASPGGSELDSESPQSAYKYRGFYPGYYGGFGVPFYGGFGGFYPARVSFGFSFGFGPSFYAYRPFGFYNGFYGGFSPFYSGFGFPYRPYFPYYAPFGYGYYW